MQPDLPTAFAALVAAAINHPMTAHSLHAPCGAKRKPNHCLANLLTPR
jgi:hypothetical protein